MKYLLHIVILSCLTQTIFAQNSSENISTIENTSNISQIASATSTVVSYDFTTSASKYYGGAVGAAILEISVAGDTTWGMVAGDANASGSINTTDYLVVKPDVGSTGYSITDVNLSGSVNTTDYLRIKPNVGKVTQVP